MFARRERSKMTPIIVASMARLYGTVHSQKTSGRCAIRSSKMVSYVTWISISMASSSATTKRLRSR
jgi:hypothetical protein